MPEANRDRRMFMAACSVFGLGSTLFPGILWAKMQAQDAADAIAVTPELIDQVAKMSGLDLTEDQRRGMVRDLTGQLNSLRMMHANVLGNAPDPALVFNPVLPGMEFEMTARPVRMAPLAPVPKPKDIEDVAFYSVRQLGELLRAKKVSSTDLTTMYLARLKRYDPMLHFVITLTEDRALAQAREADRDIASGKYRGPLHGIPWGAKDLLAVKGYKTTWGAQPYEDQVIDEDATVVKRLDAAGAVLIAKLSLGALAQNDVWFGGRTRNPWQPSQGSSGSSAGPASATSAGCVGFSIGSETQGSISSPSTVCGVTGLRPTFGRVPRTGAMTLSWSQDKLGPICRTVEDCMLVLHSISGPETGAEITPAADRSVHAIPLNWDANMNLRTLRVGYLKSAFDQESDPNPPAGRGGRGGGAPGAGITPPAAEAATAGTPPLLAPGAAGAADSARGGGGARGGRGFDPARRLEQAKYDNAVLDVLRGLGVSLVEVTLPQQPPFNGYGPAVNCEAAAAFDELTRSGRDKLMEAPVPNPSSWPATFRVAHFYPAVDYINADRMRYQLMQQMEAVFKDLDILVTPTNGGGQLAITNLTGHPAVIVPNGFHSSDGTPGSITFLGRLFGEEKMCALASAWQRKTDFHTKHPDLNAELAASSAGSSGD